MTDDSHAKIKFKKRSKASLKKKKQLRRTEGVASDRSGGESHAEDSLAGSGSGATAKIDDLAPIIDTTPRGGDEGDEEGPSALDVILAAERRRRVLGIGRNRGMDAASLGRNSNARGAERAAAAAQEASEDAAEMVRNKDLEERLKGTFAGGKLAGSNDMGGHGGEGVLAKKHLRAMEEFIQKNLSVNEGVDGNDPLSERGDQNNASTAEKEMYAELLATEEGAKGGNAPSAAGKEGDVGAGGAMMGGTGIAEVALPIDERIEALRKTERAAVENERARKASSVAVGEDRDTTLTDDANEQKDTSSEGQKAIPDDGFLAATVPVNFASGPGKRKRQDVDLVQVNDHRSTQGLAKSASTIGVDNNAEYSSAFPPSTRSASSAGPSVRQSDVSELSTSYSHNFQLHTREWVSRRRDERQSEIDAAQRQQEVEEGPMESRSRMGFEIARRLAKGEAILPSSTGATANGSGGIGNPLTNEWDRKQGGDGRASDERVWRTFMSKQRNRR